MTGIKNKISAFGFPRLIIMAFLGLLIVLMFLMDIPAPLTFSQCIVRVGINMVLGLAMVPGIMAGTGMNFALPLGIECGLLAGMISLQFDMTGVGGIFAAMVISIPFSILAGLAYSQLINRVKGSEMMVSTYVGFSVVALMCIGWLILPFNHPSIVWPIGDGLRTTITLEKWYDRALNNLWAFSVAGVEIPVGLILVISVFSFLVWLFMRSRLGLMMKAVGSNPEFAKANGIHVDSMRTLATVISTILGGIGIIIYAQGFGFYQLYNAPLMMAFPAIAAVLIGHFVPLVKIGDKVEASAWLGQVDENFQPLKIMAPFTLKGTCTVEYIADEGDYKIEDRMAVLKDEEGSLIDVNMIQRWPVKRAMKNYKEKPRPFKLLETGVRVIDTVNPIVEGGTGFIPGPFGTGKTVLQHAISKQAEADIVIIAACGERANEVVEIFTEFPELVDPHTGRKLMERTIIIANTSNMPVAAREASVYTAMTLAEYYRSMGLKVLLMADSTSRWAQALREMSNRMEELPGPDAFPMDISAIISNFYGRAGYVKLSNDETGSITFIGTVSPAGGNLKEPVTENTKKVARCFYALEQDRADKKRYPAVNPIDSYSKYIEYPEFEEYIKGHINDEWIGKVNELKTRLQRGKEIAEQINILGDDGVPVEYHVIFWKSELIDFVILQQDAFDEIDAVTPMERQEDILNMIIDICHTEFEFDNFNEVMDYFKKMINICKQMNYSKFKSEQYEGFQKQLKELIEERKLQS